MDGQKNTLEGAGDYIWLRYSTSITIAGRTRTIEIGVPMPIGADEEEREQLLREADEGMNQLTGHVENRIALMLQRVQPTQGNIPAPTPTAKPSVNPPPRPVSRPASAPAPQQAAPQQNAPSTSTPGQRAQSTMPPQPVREIREVGPEPITPPSFQNEEVLPPQTRATMGVSMPTTGDISGNLSIPQFIRVVKDRFDLNPTQAMEMLKLKSLSGVNLREKLEQLQHMLGQEANGATEKNGASDPDEKASNASTTSSEEKSAKPDGKNETPSGKIASIPTPPAPTPSKPPIPIRPNTSMVEGRNSARPQTSRPLNTGSVRGGHAPYFDEEEDFDDVLAELDEDDELDESELEALGQQRELTPQERMHAKNLVSRFRESQGAAVANPARLKVLSNVTDGQVSEQQVQDLTEGIWGVSSVKKLKVDQVESLISWAKEDDFMSEVEVVLLLLEEEAFARGNR
ncbi:MAG: hypothetical protein NVS4B11_32700 [Ktedonobacteraceae bacterium]